MAMLSKRKPFWATMSFFALVTAMAASICLGAADISLSTVKDSLFAFNTADTNHQIIREVRIPRAIAGALIGAYLAMAGTIMQGMTRNPLGDPSIMGITSGAAFGIAIAFVWLQEATSLQLMMVSFIGAAFGASLVFGVGALSIGGLTPVKLALAGATISSLLISLSTAISIHFNVAKQIDFWFAGSVNGVQWMEVVLLLLIGGPVFILGLLISKSLTVLSLGEEVSKGLGQRTKFVKIVCVFIILVLSGISVSVAGVLAFIGLIVPHITRSLIGIDYRWLILFSGLFGAILVVLADIAARMIQPPFETPLGAITTLIGGPFFLYLARREGGKIL
ncbi:FecCD family ABC transporter permease [Domibacillus epiphyticus]|uniref:Ferrichrome ABC transporter permease n=1 Tax=Domibacillus epiphyticus TaxID=1714355 RepID=A0A1V2A5F8_9BACI|nr:iron ABC transporter permease [Domibacillus epiphyticus]OMP66249.1 ferrichrome ABC transporter permease [Domibacillus epiphyticus]